jgi:hypothetical protein
MSRFDDLSIDDVIPDLKDWNNGNPIGLLTWLGRTGNYQHAIGYAEIFWPLFLEYDGCVFRQDCFDEALYADWLDRTKGDRRAVQKVMNHVHIIDIIFESFDGPTFEQAVYLGRMIKEMWSTKLKRDYPGREFVVEFFEATVVDDQVDATDFEITFYAADKEGDQSVHGQKEGPSGP